MGVLLVLIDAFSFDYLKPRYTPFLVELAKEGAARSLKPMFAFRGIEATIFTGVWPPVHNIWTEFRLRAKKVNRVSAKLFSTGLGFLDNLRYERLSKFARLGVTMISSHSIGRLTPNMIPGQFLMNFEPAMKKPIWHPNSLHVKTLFDFLRSRGKRFVCMERIPPLMGDLATAGRFEKMILRQKPSFAWIKLNSLDTAGHNYGPRASLLKENLTQMDSLVQELVEWGKKAGLDDVIIFSDHGMSSVREWHDPIPLLNQIEDGLFFVDSTMIRFWFRSELQEDRIHEICESLPGGKILTPKELVMLRVPRDPTYGELIFVLDEGHVFSPDFWNAQKRINGMHGYAYPKSASALPFLLSNDSMTSTAPLKGLRSLEFASITPWIRNALEND